VDWASRPDYDSVAFIYLSVGVAKVDGGRPADADCTTVVQRYGAQDNDGKIDYNEFVQMMRSNNPIGPGLDLGAVSLNL
jgi:hypothetical protein